MSKPLAKPLVNRGLSINSLLNNKETVSSEEDTTDVVSQPGEQNHFTDTDVKNEWEMYSNGLRYKDPVVFNAVKSFKINKKDEKTIVVNYPSDSAKQEFDKISQEFFNHLRKKVKNSVFQIEYQKDTENLKIEVVTKKTIFENFVKLNPLLKELDDFFKFDLT